MSARVFARFARLILLCGLFASLAAPAQTFPSRTITLVFPFPPGGSIGKELPLRNGWKRTSPSSSRT